MLDLMRAARLGSPKHSDLSSKVIAEIAAKTEIRTFGSRTSPLSLSW
jgi:hypothetical protein